MLMDYYQTWYLHCYCRDLFGIANGQISTIFDSYLHATHLIFYFWMITLVNVSGFIGFSPNLVCALIM